MDAQHTESKLCKFRKYLDLERNNISGILSSTESNESNSHHTVRGFGPDIIKYEEFMLRS